MISKLAFKLPEALADAVKMNVAEWRAADKVHRLWQGDASLWTDAAESKWLGWLGIVEDQIKKCDSLERFASEIRREGIADVLLLAMGGSSLCAEVLAKTFGHIPGFPRLHVLDSTDPAQVKACENQVDLASTLFIVSSKSGSTLETNIFKQYFFERATQTVGREKAGSRFIAIADPGSKMQQVAESDHFRHIFYGLPSIGGRYSALSNFGMVPATVMGLDVAKFLDRTHKMVAACTAFVPVEENPGVMLGIILGTAARNRRDKVTIIASPGISDLGAWLEQLLAESTGKQGEGIIPVDREDLGLPSVYSNDRVFVHLRLDSAPDAQQEAAIAALARAGQPVVRVSLSDVYDLGQEFFRWEIATAVAGSVMGINPFDQPDVEDSKVATRALTSAYERDGSLPAENPILEDGGIKLFTDPRNAQALANTAGRNKSLVTYLRAHLNRIEEGDYFALLAYVPMNDANEARLQEMRHALRDQKQVATCLGFGPRFLHSTGQIYKGGPNSGVFLQVTCDDAADLPVPGQKYSFGMVKAAQARGDFRVLAERGRRALRVHLPRDVSMGLSKLRGAFRQALR
jgi:glucose-6-phosphate isomerase